MTYVIISQLLLAAFLGGIIGVEREFKKREAGLQTYSLVALGACLFTVISFSLSKLRIINDPSPIILAIAIGMGFIGAGTISRGEKKVEGITTAAGLWITAAIGLAVGAKFYLLSVCAALLVLVILVGFGLIEDKIFRKQDNFKR